MDNFIERLRKEVMEDSMVLNKYYAHVELLYVGPYNAIYLTPARIDHRDRGSNIVRLSNYAALGITRVEDLRNLLDDKRYNTETIKLEIHREEDGKGVGGVIYLEECTSFFRMNCDTLVLTNIDIEQDIKDPFTKLIINKLMDNETEKLVYNNPHRKFNTKNTIVSSKEVSPGVKRFCELIWMFIYISGADGIYAGSKMIKTNIARSIISGNEEYLYEQHTANLNEIIDEMNDPSLREMFTLEKISEAMQVLYKQGGM